jgi:hypothetical protein
MKKSQTDALNVYLEIGKKRTFAGALDWPGWCRSGSDERSALQALFEYAPRYRRILRGTRLGFQTPGDSSAFTIVERLEGNSTTDFGAPAIAPGSDAQPVDDAELRRLEQILKACWKSFDATVTAAQGRPLRTGPRGGGRDVERIMRHLSESDAGYVGAVGAKVKQTDIGNLEKTHQAILSALRASAHGEIPVRGPRGGIRWSARYFVRRTAWHVLDHVWEIEDRLGPG